MNKTTFGLPAPFSEGNLFFDRLPCLLELKPSAHLASVLEDCQNHIDANEGYLNGAFSRR